MITVAHVSAVYDGDQIKYRWAIAPESHAVGLNPAAGGSCLWIGDDLGAPRGADIIESAIAAGAHFVGMRVKRQWSDTLAMF